MASSFPGASSQTSVALGRRFEAEAGAWLQDRGYRILDRNVRHGRGEVDLVVEMAGTVAFVEVKGRSGGGCGHPLDAITARKRREVEAVARWWIRTRPPARGYRFDAVAVEACSGDSSEWRITHVADAWRPGEWG